MTWRVSILISSLVGIWNYDRKSKSYEEEKLKNNYVSYLWQCTLRYAKLTIIVFFSPGLPKHKFERDKQNECPRCHKLYSQRGSMMRHLRLECGVMPQFKCPKCSYTSYRKGNINRHMLIHFASVEPRPGELGFWPTVHHISLQIVHLVSF